MKTLTLNELEVIKGGSIIPKWLTCAAAVASTAIFFGGIVATTGPLGLYVANAVLGPTIVGLGWAACAE